MFLFQNKRIIVTGGSAGIGRALAEALAREGARLALFARGEARLQDTVAAIRDAGGDAEAYVCDVNDARSVADTMDAAVAALGGLDGVVANSGFCRPGYFHEIPVEALGAMVQTNLCGTIHTLHAAVPRLIQNPESFAVITSSPAGNAAIYGFNVYGATKAALNHLAHGLRAEYRDRGLQVLTLLPPDTDTPGYQEELNFYPQETRAILQSGQVHRAEAVAAACLDAIRRGRTQVTVGAETKLLLPLVRYLPQIWEGYCRRLIRKSRRNMSQ